MDKKVEAIVERIVEREILVNASQMVRQLSEGGLCLNSASFGELYHECLARPDYSVEPEGFTIERASSRAEIENGDSPAYYWIDEDGEPSESTFDTEEQAIRNAWDEIGEQPDEFEEALEHWIVSDWLAEKLQMNDAMICRDVLGFNVWGRSETGQSLTMDSEIIEIANGVAKRF